MNTEINTLTRQLNEIHHGLPYIGITYDQRLKGISEEDFFRRPLPAMNSLAEILTHVIVWRKAALAKIADGTFTKTHDDWKDLSELKPMGMDRILNDFNVTLERLAKVISEKNDAFLDTNYSDPDWQSEKTFRELLEGMLYHDLYHLGQIGIVLKYLKEVK